MKIVDIFPRKCEFLTFAVTAMPASGSVMKRSGGRDPVLYSTVLLCYNMK